MGLNIKQIVLCRLLTYNEAMFSKLHSWRWTIVILLSLGGIYLATRLTNLTLLPIFTDEAIYIRWSQIGAHDANWRFISLVDGKQPMFTWIAMVLLRLLPREDPLFVGRLVSVFAGIGSLVGISLLTYELFRKKRVVILAALLYVVSPFTLVYDRMALYDSLVATFSLWGLYVAVRLVRSLHLDIALILGTVLGLGMLNKTSGFLSLYLLPVTLLLFDWGRKDRGMRIIRWVLLVALAAGLSQMFYSILRLSPLLHMVTAKDALFVFPIAEWVLQPFRFLEGNLRGMFDWTLGYLSVPIVVSLVGGGIAWRMTKERLLLLLWWFLPFVALAAFGKVLYPRFVLFMTMPLLVVAASNIDKLFDAVKQKTVIAGILLLVIIPGINAGVRFILNPATAPIPWSDSSQYINDWPAGWGIAEVKDYLSKEADRGPIAVYTDGTFGLLPASIELYLVDHPNVTIRGIWPLPETEPPDMIADSLVKPTYFILNQSQVAPPGWPVTLIAEYKKGVNTKDKKLRFYRVTPPASQ